jgi:hypothetical protein
MCASPLIMTRLSTSFSAIESEISLRSSANAGQRSEVGSA